MLGASEGCILFSGLPEKCLPSSAALGASPFPNLTPSPSAAAIFSLPEANHKVGFAIAGVINAARTRQHCYVILVKTDSPEP